MILASRSFALVHSLSVVMPGLVPGTHVFRATKQDVGGRDKPGHDEYPRLQTPLRFADRPSCDGSHVADDLHRCLALV